MHFTVIVIHNFLAHFKMARKTFIFRVKHTCVPLAPRICPAPFMASAVCWLIENQLNCGITYCQSISEYQNIRQCQTLVRNHAQNKNQLESLLFFFCFVAIGI